jgi:ferrous-iron efflux pump FieF
MSAGHSRSDAHLKRLAALASIGVALLLLGIKSWAVWSTGSAANEG